MKFYVKVFALTVLVTSLLVGSGLFAYIKHINKQVELVMKQQEEKEALEKIDQPQEPQVPMTELERLVFESNRINVVVLGTDGGRADTIMVASYDLDAQVLDILSIPRDTYHVVPGYDKPGQHKINSVYGYGDVDGGSLGMKTQVSQLLGIPVHHFVTLNYDGVADIVDTLNGVEINIKQNMKYDDPFADPPLHIDFTAGRQVLKGQKAVEYLRWRKNNGEEGSDLSRTDRQIDFVKQVITKSMREFKLTKVVETAFRYVYTDMLLKDMLYYTTTVIGFNPSEDIRAHRLPGDVIYNGLSYYLHDPAATEALLIEIYQSKTEE